MPRFAVALALVASVEAVRPSANGTTSGANDAYSIADLLVSPATADAVKAQQPSSVGPIPVDAKLVITNFLSLDQIAGTYMVQGTLLLAWQDPRLAMPEGEKRVQLQIGDVWQPQHDYYNGVSTTIAASKLAFLDWTGLEDYALHNYTGPTLVYTERFVSTFSMRLNFATYPFDKHALPLEIEIFGNPSTVVGFRNSRVELMDDVVDPIWTVVDAKSAISNVTKTTGIKYTRVTVHIHVMRQWLNKAISTYVPFIFLLILSYGSYFMALDQLPARTALTIITMLAAFTYYNAVSAALPPRGYFTFLDVYAVICILAAGTGVGVFLRVHHLMRVEKKTGTAAPPSEGDWFRCFAGYATAPPSERLDIVMRNIYPWFFMLTFVLILWPMSYEWYLQPYIVDDFA